MSETITFHSRPRRSSGILAIIVSDLGKLYFCIISESVSSMPRPSPMSHSSREGRVHRHSFFLLLTSIHPSVIHPSCPALHLSHLVNFPLILSSLPVVIVVGRSGVSVCSRPSTYINIYVSLCNALDQRLVYHLWNTSKTLAQSLKRMLS